MDKHMILSIFHLLLVFPFLLYTAFQRAATPDWLYTTLLVVGCFIALFHGFKFVTRYLSGSSYAWVNAVHVFLVAPLLIMIGLNKKETPRMYYELLMLLAFGGVGYHLFSLVRSLDMHSTF
jgi:hypothetical protein